MAIFGRRRNRPAEPASPIVAFWTWWGERGRHIDPSAVSDDVAADLTERVQAVHADLSWHFGKGSSATHRLTLSASGSPTGRVQAERWLRAAEPSAMWEFAPTIEADPDVLNQQLQIHGTEIELSETVVAVEVDRTRQRVDVHVHHAVFGGLPERARLQVAFMVLDWLVGEDAVERWVGEINAPADRPADAIGAAAVATAVAELRSQHDPDGWSVARGQVEGRPVLATYRSGLRWLDRPILDRHHVLEMTYPADEVGMPADPATSETIRGFESDVEGALGAAGIYLGRELSGGVASFHVYTDGEDQNAEDRLRRAVATRNVRMSTSVDPSWREVRRLTG